MIGQPGSVILVIALPSLRHLVITHLPIALADCDQVKKALTSNCTCTACSYTCIYGDQIAQSRVLYPSPDAVLQYIELDNYTHYPDEDVSTTSVCTLCHQLTGITINMY